MTVKYLSQYLLVFLPLIGISDGYRILSVSLLESASGDLGQVKVSNGEQMRVRLARHANLELSKNISAVLENLLKDYDNTMRPGSTRGPTLITTNMLIRSLGPISELDMEYSMDCYFRQMWRDERLSFNSTIDQLSLSITMLERIWKPDTYFVNGRGSYVHMITRPNKLIRLARDGSILYSMRLTIKAKCPMLLQRFPMDQQTCPLTIGSYAYNTGEVRYAWDPDRNVSLEPGIHLSQFDLISYPVRSSTVHRKTGSDRPNSVEAFSVLQVHFNLQRHTGYFLIQVYVPCILIVVLSWVSFWINREATADRVGLGITSVLTLSTISIDTRTSLPKVSYATAMDWFLLTSFGFIIATLLEFAGVHYFTKVGSGEVQPPCQPVRENSANCGVASPRLTDGSEWVDVATVSNHCKTNSIYQSNPRWYSQESALSRFQDSEAHIQVVVTMMSPLTEVAGEYMEYEDALVMVDDVVTVPPPPPPPLHRSPHHQSPSIPAESCWYQVFHCLMGSVEYRRKRQMSASDINSVSRIDRASRLLFPLLFCLLNFFYWNFYWSEPPSEEW